MSGDVSIDGIKVDFTQVEAGAQSIDATAKQIDTILDDLHRQIQRLDEIWQGSTSDDYKHTKDQWLTAAKDLQSVLAKIGTAVSAAHQAYLDTESRNAAAWG